MDFRGQVAVVTGASRGIGRAVALRFAELGASVVVNYVKSREGAEQLVQQIQRGGARALAVQADVREKGDVERMVAQAREAFGRIDVLVCNAGAIEVMEWEGMTLEHWDEMLRANATSAMLCCQAVMPGMIEHGYGRIVLVSSLAAERGSFLSAGYAAAKAGVLGLMRTLVRIGAPHNVTVNAVVPGVIETDMVNAWITDEFRHMIVSTTPAGRLGRPEEVAAAVVFLASREASYISGAALDVNGGAYMR